MPSTALNQSMRLALIAGTVLLVTLSIGCAPTAYDLGTRALEMGALDEAVSRFDESLALEQEPFRARRDRGAARLETGELETALIDLMAAKDLRENDARLHWLLGRAYSDLARYDEASQAYRRYQMLVSSRAVKRLAAQRLAQLRMESARAAANNLLDARQLGVRAEPNTVAMFAFRPYDQQDPREEDLKICRALSVWVTADLQKVSSLRPVEAEALEMLYEAQGTSLADRWQLDPATMVASGNLQPARHMVRGEFGSVGDDRVVMLGVLIDSDRREVQDCPIQEDGVAQLFDMETAFVLDLLARMGIEPTPEERLAIGEKPTRHPRAFLAFADGLYRLWDLGDLDGAQASFENALAIDPSFTMAFEAAHQAGAQQLGDKAVSVPPPPVVNPGQERAMASAAGLGLGLIPESEQGDATGARTQDVVTARGAATVRVRAEITP